MILFSILLQNENCTEGERKTLKINMPYLRQHIQRLSVIFVHAVILEKNTPSQFKNRNSKTKMVFEILMAWENEFVKIFTLFPEIHAPVLSHFITLKHYS